MKKLTLAFLLFPLFLHAQNNSMSGHYIRGFVKNNATQEPVKKALVRLFLDNKPLEAVLTNDDGEFKIGVCGCFNDSLLTLTVVQEAYLPLQESFIPLAKSDFTFSLTYDYQNGTSKTFFRTTYQKAFFKRSLSPSMAQRFYINCVGEIKQGTELKQYSEQNWELTNIGTFGP